MKSRRLPSSALIIFLLCASVSYSQVQTARPTSVSGACGGYFEYLPQGYNSNTWQSYPLIIFIHGIGELGNGTTDLGNILNCWTALPRLIANGSFPSSVNAAGQNFSFLVISPQFKWWPSASDVNDVIDYAIRNYRVDQSRIYVTGLSMGGGAVWDFAGAYPTKAAAVVPVCGAAGPDASKAQAIANARLAVWATHNQDDGTVSTSNTTGWVNILSQYGAEVQSTIFQASGHDAWTRTYDPSFTKNGVNIYQWMLQHQKGSSTPPPAANQSPVANAGINQTITLPQTSVSLNGSGTDPDGTINFYEWSQASGPSPANITSPYSAATIVNGLTQGTYVFTLKVTDNKGATATSNVTVTVNAGSLPIISTSGTRIEAENYANMSGVQKESTGDAGGGQNLGYIDYGDWMDYSVNISSAGTYSVNLRVASPAGGQLQIKNSSGNVLATVNVPNTGGYQNWQTVSANVSLPAGSQTLRIYSTSNGWNFNWWEVGDAGGGTPASSSSSRIEAENYANMSGVQKESTGDAGGGQNLGYIDYGDWMDYSVNISSAGTYSVNLRVASPAGGQLQIKNSSGNVLATVNVPNTGGYQNWQTVSANVSLPAGSQTLRIYSTSNGWNFNWWEVGGNSGTVTARAVSTSDVALTSTSALAIYPNPVTDKFQLQLTNELTGAVTVQVYDILGSLQKQFSLSKPDGGTSQYYLSIGELAKATYIIKVTMTGWSESKQIIKQ
jgi:dienelactone hydrolase